MTFFMVCQGREIELLVGTDIRDGNGTTRVINWCGCFVQDPHPAVRALGFLPQEGHGVYVTRYCLFDCLLQNATIWLLGKWVEYQPPCF